MTTPPQKTPSPPLPLNWQGGTLNHLDPLVPDFHDEDQHADPEWVALMSSWAPIEHLSEADPPGRWGFDPGGLPGAGAGPRQTEARSGAVLRVSATGVVLDDFPDVWLNVSRYGPPVDLRGVHTGDICTAEVEVGRDGRCYLTAIRVIPLDGFAPPEPAREPES